MTASPDLPSSAAPLPKRKPGAPPGNTNAVKHGRHNYGHNYGHYSARFGSRTPQNLDPSGLSGQIVLLKVYLYHLKKLSPFLDNIHDQAAHLRVLCLAMSSLTHLILPVFALIRLPVFLLTPHPSPLTPHFSPLILHASPFLLVP